MKIKFNSFLLIVWVVVVVAALTIIKKDAGADTATGSNNRGTGVFPITKDGKAYTDWQTLLNDASGGEYYSGKKPAFAIGFSSIAAVIPTTNFEIDHMSFYVDGGTAGVTMAGGLTGSVIYQNGIVYNSVFSVPTASSVTFTISSLTTGATIHYEITGVEDQ